MDDQQIIRLFWNRSESAIRETAAKYGSYCRTIAEHILCNREDSEECVSDTWLRAWNAIPPERPRKLSVYLGKITRNLALDRLKERSAEKRGGDQILLALEELDGFLIGTDDTEQVLDMLAATDAINHFLASLPKQSRTIFLRRYWYFYSVREIARDCGISASKVKMSLLRSRKKLKIALEEGIIL